MAITVKERPGSRRVTVSLKNPTAEFLVVATADAGEDSADVRDAIIAWLPKWYTNLTLLLESVDIEHIAGGNLSYGSAKYTLPVTGVDPATGAPIDGQGDDAQPPNPPEQPADDAPLGPEFAWETAGGTTHLTKSYEVVDSVVDPAIANAGGGPPDRKGAIGVSKDGVEGVDVPSPLFTWSVTYKFAFVTRKYLKKLRELTGTVNNAEWFGRSPREVRFDGSSGRIGNNNETEVTFRFTEQETQFMVAVGDMVIAEVKGFDYLDVGFGPSVDQDFLIEVPQVAYVHRIYRESDFSELGIG